MSDRTATHLVNEVERRVANGDLAAGERLPSSRQLASDLGIAPNTVAAAYRRLRERGVVEGRGRQGTRVVARSPVRVSESVAIPLGIVDAATGNPDLGLLPKPSTQMLIDAFGSSVRYGGAMVVPELAAAGAKWLADDGLMVGRLGLTHGAMDAIERILATRFAIGDQVGVEDPGHMPVHQIVRSLGMRAVPIKVDDRGIKPDEIKRALELGVAAVVMTPRAHNPTGAAVDKERACELREVLAMYPEVMVIEDDHAGPVAGVPAFYLDHERVRWAVVRSVAKSLGPDYRLALVAGDGETLDRMEGRMQLGAGWVSHSTQRVVASLLEDPESQAIVQVAAGEYATRRTRLIAALVARGIEASGASGLQVWVPVANEESVVASVGRSGYVIRGSSNYRFASGAAIRATVSSLTDDQIDGLAEALADAVGLGTGRLERKRLTTTLAV